MAQNFIEGKVSTEVVEFQPGGVPATFTVSVQNLSEQFAQFRVELFAPGCDPNIGHRWYTLYPEVSAIKPPGDTTEFAITITETPIPGAELINLTVQISSLQFRDIQRLPLRLRVTPGSGPTRLQVILPIRHLVVYPRQLVQIPVQVFNPNQKNGDVILKFVGLHPLWLNEGEQRRILVGAGQITETAFSCQPPIALQAPSGQYTFKVEAYLFGNLAGEDQGILEIVAVGSVMFSCSPREYWIPQKNPLLPNRSNEPANYELQLRNVSNLGQMITVQAEGKDLKRCQTEMLPASVECQTGQTQNITFKASKKRPWIGLNQKLQFQLITSLSDPRLGKTDPPAETITLHLRPILPLWLQLLGVLGLLALLLLLLPRESHTAPVNTVQLSGNINPILSGSDDQTVRAWEADPDHFFCHFLGWQSYCLKSKGIAVPKNNKGTAGKSVTVLRFRPEKTDRVAVGLDNGEIFLWDVLQNYKTEAFSQQKSDRVFALIFTLNSEYLFSGHGLKLRLWKLNEDKLTPLEEESLRFAIYTLALTQDEQKLIVAGRYNRIWVGDWSDRNKLPKFRSLPYPRGSDTDYIYSIDVIDNNLLVTADTQGYIRIWDLQQCKDQGVDALDCKPLDEWQQVNNQGQSIPIRSVKFAVDNLDRKKYLVSGGDDGKIIIWPLTEEGTRQAEFFEGKVIAQYPQGINSIDVKIKDQRLLIVSGSADNQVRLNSYPLKNRE